MTRDHSQQVDQCDNDETIAASFGRQLSAAREAADQSVASIAQELCITSSVIALLEAGSWENAGPDVYVRGYVIAYCRLVNMDPAEAIYYFKQRESERVASDSLEAINRQKGPGFAQYQRVVGYAAATLLIGPALIFWVAQGFRGADSQLDKDAPIQVLQGPALVVQEQSSLQSEQPQVGVEAPIMASMSTVPETVASTPANLGLERLSVQATDTVVELDSGGHQDPGILELDFKEDVWLEVSDGSGQRLGYGLMSAHSKRIFSIAQGLSVRLGNADSVVARVDGEVLDIRPYINLDVASFNLPEATLGNIESESSVD